MADQLVKVTANDLVASYLNNKLTAGSNVSFTILFSGANESIGIDFNRSPYIERLEDDNDMVYNPGGGASRGEQTLPNGFRVGYIELTQNDYVNFAVRLPDEWDNASDVKIRPYVYLPSGISATNYTFEIGANAVADGGTLDNTITETGTITISMSTQYQMETDEIVVVPAGSPAAGKLLQFKMRRSNAGATAVRLMRIIFETELT